MKSHKKTEIISGNVKLKSLSQIEQLTQIEGHRAQLEMLRNIFKRQNNVIHKCRSQKYASQTKVLKLNKLKANNFNVREKIDELRVKQFSKIQNREYVSSPKSHFQKNIGSLGNISSNMGKKIEWTRGKKSSEIISLQLSNSLKLKKLKNLNKIIMNRGDSDKLNPQKLMVNPEIQMFLNEVIRKNSSNPSPNNKRTHQKVEKVRHKQYLVHKNFIVQQESFILNTSEKHMNPYPFNKKRQKAGFMDKFIEKSYIEIVKPQKIVNDKYKLLKLGYTPKTRKYKTELTSLGEYDEEISPWATENNGQTLPY